MGLFNKIFSDVSEMGSAKSKFKKKFINLSKLLSDFSYGDSSYSEDLSVQRIKVAYQELIEYGQIVKDREIIKIYFRDADIDIPVQLAKQLALLWMNDVLYNKVLFTNTYMKQSIDILR